MTDPTTYKQVDRKKVLPEASLLEAQRAFDDLTADAKQTALPPAKLPLSSELASLVFERKLARGLTRSEAGRVKWHASLT